MAASQPPVIEGMEPITEEEAFRSKFIRKVRENPVVPLGCLATVGVLTCGLIAFKQGKTRQSQLLMRARILSQGFTIVALMVGVFMTAMKTPPPKS